MKFGFAAAPVGPDGMSDDLLYAQALEDCAFGQQLGFDSAWTLEHHFTPYFPQPDLIVFLSHVAARCPGLGLGTCVIVVPWHHPLRLAEQIAMLSLLSQGDLYLGLGRGTARYEFERFEIDMAHTRGMFAEAVEIIHKGLAGKPFSHRGAHYNFPETLLRPIARPERVHLFGAVGSPESAGVMGKLGLPLIHTSNFPDDTAAGFVQAWQAATGADEARSRAQGFPIMVNPTIIADSDDEALELGHLHYKRFAEVQMEHYESKADYWKDIPGYQAHSRFFANLGRMVDDADFRGRFLSNKFVGTADKVIRRIETMRDRLHVGHIVTVHAQYGMAQPLRRRSMQNFAERVMPHFRAGPAAA